MINLWRSLMRATLCKLKGHHFETVPNFLPGFVRLECCRCGELEFVPVVGWESRERT